MQSSLSFEQAPPISVPYRFFLTGPLFGAAAGMVLAWLGPGALASRWTPGALALTHLIAAGFMLQVMCGALLQFVAVVAGANIWRPQLTAAAVHSLITLGAALLVLAFLSGRPSWFLAAVLVLILALGPFVAIMALALLRTPAGGMSIRALRLALLGLLVTVAFGAALGATLGGHNRLQSSFSLFTLVDVHVAWGLGGWALMLLLGVSFMVVPMFQLTPAYPVWLTRLTVYGLFAVLCLWSVQLLPGASGAGWWQAGVMLAAVLLSGTYAGATLGLQARRRRRRTDVTFVFWRVAMVALLIFSVSLLLFLALPQLGGQPRAPLWLGVLALAGVFVPVMMGMLYKIMPFLNWLHLQRMGGSAVPLPNMKQMICERMMRLQLLLYLLALALLLAAVIWPVLALPAGITFCLSCLWLEWNLIGATRVYLHCRARIRSGAEIPAPGKE